MKLEYFGNDRYLLLKKISTCQITAGGDTYIPLSQQEIADICGFSKSRANRIINELIDAHVIHRYKGCRGKYLITAVGNNVLLHMDADLTQNIEK